WSGRWSRCSLGNELERSKGQTVEDELVGARAGMEDDGLGISLGTGQPRRTWNIGVGLPNCGSALRDLCVQPSERGNGDIRFHPCRYGDVENERALADLPVVREVPGTS